MFNIYNVMTSKIFIPSCFNGPDKLLKCSIPCHDDGDTVVLIMSEN